MFQILITSLAAGMISQSIKPLIKSNQAKFDRQSFFSYSGMPSSHAAMVVSLATIVGLIQGFNSPLFAVCLIFGLLVVRDALGLRRYLGQYNEIINNLIKNSKDNFAPNRAFPELAEKIGHTAAQIIAGSLLGFLISLASYYIF